MIPLYNETENIKNTFYRDFNCIYPFPYLPIQINNEIFIMARDFIDIIVKTNYCIINNNMSYDYTNEIWIYNNETSVIYAKNIKRNQNDEK